MVFKGTELIYLYGVSKVQIPWRLPAIKKGNGRKPESTTTEYNNENEDSSLNYVHNVIYNQSSPENFRQNSLLQSLRMYLSEYYAKFSNQEKILLPFMKFYKIFWWS